MAAVRLDLALDLLAVGDAGGLELGIHVVEVLELGAENADLNVAGAGNDHLVGLGVIDEGEGNVFLAQLVQAAGDLVVLALGLGRDAHGVAGFGDLDGGQLDIVLGIGDGVAGLPVHLADGHDIAAAGLGDLGILLAAHGVHTAELIVGGGAHIAQGHTGRDLAGENLDKAVLAELVGYGLEHEAEHAVVLLLGGGAVIGDALQHGDGADIGHRVGGEHGNNRAFLHADLETFDDVGLIQLHIFKELLHELLSGAGSGLHELGTQIFHMARVSGGDSGLLGLGALGDVGDIVHQIDNAGTVGGGDGDGADDGAVLALEGLEGLEVIAVLLVALGDAEHDGQFRVLQVVPASLAADGQGVRRVLGGGDDHAALHCAQGAEHIAHKVEVAGAVKHVDLHAAVVQGGDGGGNGDLAGGFLRVIVADGGPVGDLTHAVDGAGAEQHALRKAGLAVVAVADQADVANVFRFVAHVSFPLC